MFDQMTRGHRISLTYKRDSVIVLPDNPSLTYLWFGQELQDLSKRISSVLTNNRIFDKLAFVMTNLCRCLR